MMMQTEEEDKDRFESYQKELTLLKRISQYDVRHKKRFTGSLFEIQEYV
jgi:hypothetical protein